MKLTNEKFLFQVEMVYSLLSMLGTQDREEMSRTLLAMSRSPDMCLAMRQAGMSLFLMSGYECNGYVIISYLALRQAGMSLLLKSGYECSRYVIISYLALRQAGCVTITNVWL